MWGWTGSPGGCRYYHFVFPTHVGVDRRYQMKEKIMFVFPTHVGVDR